MKFLIDTPMYESWNNYTDGILDNRIIGNLFDVVFEDSQNLEDSYLVMERLYPRIQLVLKTSYGDSKFKQTVGRYVDKH